MKHFLILSFDAIDWRPHLSEIFLMTPMPMAFWMKAFTASHPLERTSFRPEATLLMTPPIFSFTASRMPSEMRSASGSSSVSSRRMTSPWRVVTDVGFAMSSRMKLSGFPLYRPVSTMRPSPANSPRPVSRMSCSNTRSNCEDCGLMPLKYWCCLFISVFRCLLARLA